jgi:recombination protein RecR
MDPIERLAKHFERFPGIGPRQAQRFVQFLLRSSVSQRKDFMDALQSLGGSVHQCSECMRFHAGKTKLCSICSQHDRNPTHLAVVATDADLLALERSGTFRGNYFVVGGTISLTSESMRHMRVSELLETIDRKVARGLTEVTLAFPANPEGDVTAIRLTFYWK